MNIAFWGGCVNRQQNIDMRQHYHTLVRDFVEVNTGVTPKTWLRFYSSYHELHRELMLTLNRETHYDYMVVFLRPFPLMALTKLLIRYTDTKMKSRFALHPRFSKHKYYDFMAKEYKVGVASNSGSGVWHRTFQLINDFAGDRLTLPQWMYDEIISQLAEAQALAMEKKTRLILAGPMLYPAVDRINNICIELNRRIEIFAAQHGILHINLARVFDANGNRLVENDGKHLTAAAHLLMAEQISKYVSLAEPILAPAPGLQ